MGRSKKNPPIAEEAPGAPKPTEGPWVAEAASDRERARYPVHGLRHKAQDATTGIEIWVVDCAAPLVLPEQVPIANPIPGRLFCVGCKGLVDATEEQASKVREAADAEGFVPVELGAVQLTPGSIEPVVRTALYGLGRLYIKHDIAVLTDDAERAVRAATAPMERLGLFASGKLTARGRELAAKIVAPEVDADALARTSDPSLAPKAKEKKRARKALVADLVPRCATVACFTVLDREGKCSGGCGYEERKRERVAEVNRCWDIVDARAPEKVKRVKKPKGQPAEAVAT